jgi:uncharacterized membrane protein YbhN (UPF0104 family)
VNRPTFNHRRFLLRFAFGGAVTAVLFFFLARNLSLAELEKISNNLDWGLTVVGLLLYLLLYFFRAWRFLLMARSVPLPLMLCITALHNFALRILPVRTGELVYGYLVKRVGAVGMGESLISLLLLRLLDIIAVVVIFSVTLALDVRAYLGNVTTSLIVAGVVALVGVLAVAYFPRLLHLCLSAAHWFARLSHLERKPRSAKLLDQLDQTVRVFDEIPLSTTLKAALLTAIQWGIAYASAWSILHAMGIPVSLPQSILGSTASTVTGFLPISAVGNFGALEAGWQLGFTLVGLSETQAAASAIGFSLITLAYALVLAALAWLGLWIGTRVRQATPDRLPTSSDRSP